jgi:hypothetical protein
MKEILEKTNGGAGDEWENEELAFDSLEDIDKDSGSTTENPREESEMNFYDVGETKL